MGYEHIEVEHRDHVGVVWLSRPDKRNALSEDMWADLPSAIAGLDSDQQIRVIVLGGRGAAFSVGIDLGMLGSLQDIGGSSAETNMRLYRKILELQATATSLAETNKPVIAAIQGWCLGAGMDLATACDIRLAAADAVFSIRETRMGLVADTGVLQRLPAIVGAGVTAHMAYTGDDFDAGWALEKGLVNTVYPDVESLHAGAFELAGQIASNSPLVTQGIKKVLSETASRSVEDALEYVAQWNSSFLISNDLMEAINAFLEKRDPDYTGT